MARRRGWLPIVGGIAVLIVFIGIGVGFVSVNWMREHLVVTEEPGEAEVGRAFEDVRARFHGRAPLLELDERGTPRYTGGAPPTDAPGSAITSVHLLVWDPHERRLARAEFPFWLVRLKSGPVTFGASVGGLDRHGVDLDPAVVERFGPGLLLDSATPEGQHVLVWAQ
jgi:hypothetical protein